MCVFFCAGISPAQIGDLSPNAFSDAGLKRDMHPSMAQHKYLWLPTVSSIDPREGVEMEAVASCGSMEPTKLQRNDGILGGLPFVV